VVLRPTWKVAAVRLLVTGLLWLISFGWLGVDYELRQLVERRRASAEEVASFERSAVEEGERLRGAGRAEEARAAEASMRAFSAKILREREEEVGRMEAAQRPWRWLLEGLAGAGILLGVAAPLSVVWQRVVIERDGEEVVVRKKGLWTRTQRVGVAAARRPEVGTRAQLDPEHSWQVMGYAWGVRLAEGGRAVVFWAGVTKEPGEMSAEARRLVEALLRVAG
jgi:hypothetical protein